MGLLFLREKDNFPIILIGIALLVFDVFVIMQGLIGWESSLGRLGISGGLLTTVMLFVGIVKKIKKILSPTKQSFSIYDGDKSDFLKNKNYEIKRNKAVARLIKSIDQLACNNNTLKCVFLTGESGSGKSYLLKEFLIPKLQERDKYFNSVHYYCSRAQCNDFIKSESGGNFKIVIFDQFEYYYTKKGLLDKINSLKSENTIIVFAFQEKDMAKILQELEKKLFTVTINNNLYDHLLFLETDQSDIVELLERSSELLENILDPSGNLDKEDIMAMMPNLGDLFNEHSSPKDIEKELQRKIRKSENYFHMIRIFYSLLIEIAKKRKPLVSFYAMAHIMGINYFNNDLVLSKVSTDIPDDLIEQYLETWAKKHQNPENANALLYLLSNMRRYDRASFQRLLFEYSDNNSSSDSYDNYFETLSKLFFVAERDNSLSLMHEYFRVKILDYLNSTYTVKDLSEIKGNIDGHREIFSSTDNGKAITCFSSNLDTYKNAQAYVKKYCLVLLAGIVIIQIYNFIVFYSGQVLSPVYATQRIFMSIAVIISTYYVYNYIKKVFCLFDKWIYICASFVGILSIWVALFIPQWWGIPIGLNILTVGFIHHVIIKKYGISDLLELSRMPKILGATIVVLGVYYGLGFMQFDWFIRFYLVESDIVGLFILYIVYIVSCVGMHINQRYMLNRIVMINNSVYATRK